VTVISGYVSMWTWSPGRCVKRLELLCCVADGSKKLPSSVLRDISAPVLQADGGAQINEPLHGVPSLHSSAL
jgi:hypothetical protein